MTKKCGHANCKNRALPNGRLCRYCAIWDLAHCYGKQNEHIHCKKTTYGCDCKCLKRRE